MKAAPLLLLLLCLSACAASLTSAPSPLVEHWLANASARGELLSRWSRDRRPLAAALRASEPSLDPICALDLHALLQERALWALRMKDASVKVPPGLLAGIWTHPGDWDECVAVRGVSSTYPRSTFNGQMCMVKLSPQIGSRIPDHGFLSPKVGAFDNVGLLSYVQLSLGMCLPDSCSALDVQTLLAALLSDLPIVDGIHLVPRVSEKDCKTQDAPWFDSRDIVAIMILGILASLVIISTLYDLVTPEVHKQQLPAAFSVISNARKLLALPNAKGDHTLSCLHGMRFLSMCWVVLGHRYTVSLIFPNMNPNLMSTIMYSFDHLFLTNATLSVDTFFVLSGLLVGYLFFKQVPSKRRINLPLYYLHRYIRLTPAFAMMILLSTTVLRRVAWGPFSEFIDSHTACQQNWWNTLIYLGNYIRPNQQCVAQSWYLMVDMQLFWLSPLFLIPLARKPKLGLVWILSLCLAGLIFNFCFLYIKDLSVIPMATMADPEKSAFYQKWYYIPTHTRFVPYLLGLLAGYLIATRQAEGRLQPFSFWKASCLWLLATICLLSALMVFYVFVKELTASLVAASLYGSLYRAVWGLGVVLVAYLCAAGSGGVANALLSWWGFHVLGRLSYAIFLVHPALQSAQVSSLKTLLYVGDGIILGQFFSDLALSVLFGVVLSLTCESPFMILEKELIVGLIKRRKVDKTEANDVEKAVGIPQGTSDKPLSLQEDPARVQSDNKEVTSEPSTNPRKVDKTEANDAEKAVGIPQGTSDKPLSLQEDPARVQSDNKEVTSVNVEPSTKPRKVDKTEASDVEKAVGASDELPSQQEDQAQVQSDNKEVTSINVEPSSSRSSE